VRNRLLLKHLRRHNFRSAAFILVAGLLCTFEPSRAQVPAPALGPMALVTLRPFRDPWPAGRERWWDVADNPFHAYLDGSQTFSYANAGAKDVDGAPQVTLSYHTAPPVPYFIGRIDARGLKPNFAYQLKLVGKPVKGTLGWGAEGDDTANERLGYAARWFCGHPIHAGGTNFNDSHYIDYYKNALPGAEHNMYGYIYMGQFITDGNGDAHVDFTGDYAYHISWASWQNVYQHVFAGMATVRGEPAPGAAGGYRGYGAVAPATSVAMYREKEAGRTEPITLPPGTYRCRFMLTEESFHNPVAARPAGGFWRSVLATEDHIYDKDGNIVGHDTDPANDVVFTIGSDPASLRMSTRVTVTVAKTPKNEYEATASVTVTDAIGRRLRGAAVTGNWSGAYSEAAVTATTGGDGRSSDGVAYFTTKPVVAPPGSCFTFTVTDVVKTGRTYDFAAWPGAQACLPGLAPAPVIAVPATVVPARPFKPLAVFKPRKPVAVKPIAVKPTKRAGATKPPPRTNRNVSPKRSPQRAAVLKRSRRSNARR